MRASVFSLVRSAPAVDAANGAVVIRSNACKARARSPLRANRLIASRGSDAKSYSSGTGTSMNFSCPLTIAVSGAQLRVTLASMASMYAGGDNDCSPLMAASTERPSNSGGAATPARSRVVGARSMRRDSPSHSRRPTRGPAQMIHGTRTVTS